MDDSSLLYTVAGLPGFLPDSLSPHPVVKSTFLDPIKNSHSHYEPIRVGYKDVKYKNKTASKNT